MIKTIIAALISLGTCLIVGSPIISYLKRLKYGQIVRDDGPSSHLKKSGTPSMGGIIILIGISVALLLTKAFINPKVLVASIMTLFMGMIGFLDDYIKIVKKRSLGLRAREKIILQFVAATALSIYIYSTAGPTLSVPFFSTAINLGIFYIPFGIIFIVGFVNAVNLTDGLDGLASGAVGVAAIAYAIICVIQKSYEMATFSTAVAGACMGFAVFNVNPAKVFMGDTGSLALGGALVSMAMLSKTEILFFIIGGVFLIEAVSVIIQVTSFKFTGRRVFKMSPIHHHYELSGIEEVVIVKRFWMLAALFGLLGIVGL